MLETLKKGNRVNSPEQWKNVQTGTNSIAAIASLAIVVMRVFGVNIPITDEQIVVVAGGIATVLGVVNSIVVNMTSRKVGLPSND